MSITSHFSRRSFLRQGSKALALPFLPSLLPSQAQAALEKTNGKAVKRLLWMSMGHGHMEKHFYPTQAGDFKSIKLPPAWKHLQKNLQYTTMLGNLSNNENKQPHDGSEALLSSCNVVGFQGKSRHNSISCDQVAAAHLGQQTRYASMQFNCRSKHDGNGHGRGALSYGEDGSPLPGLRTPLDVYHSLFGGGLSKQEQLQQLRREQSIFDLLKIDSTATKRTLSKDDREKLEEYSTGVREIEKKLSRQAKWVDVPYPKATISKPKSTLVGESEILLMFKMITIAYQIDSTRIITYRMPDAGLLNSMNISHSPHTLSHYGVNSALHELNLKRSTKWLQLYSKFIDMMRSAKDPLDPNGGTLFDNSLVYWGGGLRTAHRNKNVPCFLTGGGFSKLKHGQHHIAPEDDTALANLWTTMLQDAGAQITKFADSTGTAQTLYT